MAQSTHLQARENPTNRWKTLFSEFFKGLQELQNYKKIEKIPSQYNRMASNRIKQGDPQGVEQEQSLTEVIRKSDRHRKSAVEYGGIFFLKK